MVPPSDDSPKSLGDGATGSDVEPSEPSSPQTLGDQSTTGDMGSSISDLVDVGEDFGEETDEIIDLKARYEIQETLGIGGMGEVVLARDKRLNRQVAIKRLKEELGANRKAAQRFLTEAQSVAALNHFNIVQIYDYGRASDGPFIVMEYVGGGSLAEVLADGEPLELGRVIELGSQLCEAIGVAHQAGIIHRDIKPANVLMTAEGMPKLTDFGLARQETVDGGQTQAGAVLGTLDFMPLEQKVDATQTDARSDLWSVGATIYQMTTGKSPRVIRLHELPGGLQDVLGKALEDAPDERYQTAEEFREALREVRPASTPTASEGTLAEGECPSCGTTNDSSRKFCKQGDCAGPLRVSCFSCEEQIPIWDAVCGECGGKQQELLATRRTEIQGQRDEAEVLGRQFEYTRARELVVQVQSESDPRIQDHQGWATAFLAELTEEEQEQHQRAAELVTEAESYRSAYDYSAAAETLGRIPKPLRTPEIRDLLEEMRSAKQESSELLTTIRECAKKRQLDGLLELVERALELLPQREDLQTIKGQLEAREKRRSPTVSLADLVDSHQPIPSARIIESLAARHGVGFDQAAGVIDGFWDHLLDAERYNQGNRKFSLPHFGTFSLGRGHEQQIELKFVSRPITDLQFRRNRSGSQRPSTSWIDHWERHEGSTPARLSGLSLKRRLSVLIAGDTGLDLRTTFGLLWDLVEAVTDIMAGGKASVRWARRGEMGLDSDSNCYTFRTYKRLSDRLAELPAPSRGRQKRASRERKPSMIEESRGTPQSSFGSKYSPADNPAAAIVKAHMRDCSESRLHVAPDIPSKMLANAMAKYMPNVKETDVLLLYDDTVWGGGREGISLTRDTLYWHALGETPGSISYHEVAEVSIGKKSLVVRSAGREYDISAQLGEDEERRILKNLLRKLCHATR